MDKISNFDYYSRLIDIWSHQDESFWTSYNIFLVMQGIIIVAIFQAYSVEKVGHFIAVIIAVFGFLITIAWLYSGNRRKAAIRLTSQQARYLEKKIFLDELKMDNNEPAGDVTDYFPMFFSGNRAVFSHPPITLEPYELKIKEYYNSNLKQGCRGKINRHFSSKSESDIMTLWVPFLFIIIWVVLLLWAL